jgi:hypothetical protein
MMSIGAQAKPSAAEDGFNAGLQDQVQGKHASSHHGSTFTLGNQASLENVEGARPTAPEQQYPLRNANA